MNNGFQFPDQAQLDMRVMAFYQMPSSVSKKKRQQMLDQKIRPTKKPDADNILKVVADSLNQIAYHTHRDRTHGRKAPVERRVPKCTLFNEWLPWEYQKCEKCLEATRNGKEKRLPGATEDP